MSRRQLALAVLAALALLLAAVVAVLNLQDSTDTTPAAPVTADSIARGAYLARAGNCAGCHSDRGGAAYAGGRGIATPFGTVYAGNLTPDASGLGAWTVVDFRRALRHGRGRDGRLLVPAFPYTHFTQVSRDDADALFAYLRSVPPVPQTNRPHALRFPYNTQAALAVWRALYFRPGAAPAQPGRSAEWHRGAYLVNGLGHCSACHGGRNGLGASAALDAGRGGAPLPLQAWYAPSLADPQEAGLQHWPMADAVALLKTGQAPQGIAQGPMAEVVAQSTQHLTEDDLRAMVSYLQALPERGDGAAHTPLPPRPAATMALGAALYKQHCADCHGAQGQGAPGIYPALAGNRLVTMARTSNLLLAVTRGGFAPGTAAHPRPYGMPPFDLGHDELAALLTWLRASWGHDAPPVSEVDALLAR
jgi:mono/diheme cytochrome c family protein